MAIPANSTRNANAKSVQKGSNSAAVVEALSEFLGSTYVLYQKSLFYHWNVTGPNFMGLHTLFEQHYNDLHMAGDQLAERIRALGAIAPGTMREFLAHSRLKEDAKLPDAPTMIKNLMRDHEASSAHANEVLKVAEEAEDDVTVDMMVERMTFHDKAAWMLRALTQ